MNQQGFYFGTCTNTTINVTANIALMLEQIQGGHATGTLGIYGDLQGGSGFAGIVTGESICFTTHDPAFNASVVWQGQFAGQSIRGTYRATVDKFFYRMIGLGSQEGTWECHFAHASGDALFDVGDSSRIRVRADNRIEGPFPLQSFVDLVLRNHWPATAHVSIDDRDQWIPLGLIHDAIVAALPPTTDNAGFFKDVGTGAAKKVLSGLAASIVLGFFGIDSD